MAARLPAEKTHYRRGLALGLTLAETFSIVVFILLLACAALLGYERVERDSAEAQRDTARVDLLITQEMVRGNSMSWGNAHAWFERSRELLREVEIERRRTERAEGELAAATARAAEAERALATGGAPDELVARLGAQTDSLSRQAREMDVLRDSLARGDRELRRAIEQADSLAERAMVAEEVAELVEPLREEIADRDEDEASNGVERGSDLRIATAADAIIEQAARAERLEDSLAHARNTVSALDSELQGVRELLQDDSVSVVDSLRSALDESRFENDGLRVEATVAEQERDDAIGRANYLQTQVEQLRQGTGIDPPPCWMDRDGSPEYVFRVELTDRGMRLFNISPPRRVQTDVEAMEHLALIDEGHDYDPATFLRLTLPFYEIGVSRTEPFGPMGCRFWIRPVDRTGDRKEIFRERESQLWRRFWFRW
jgi:hypothetical protein